MCYVGKYIAKWLDLLLMCSFYHFLKDFLTFSGFFLLLVYLLTFTYILKYLTIVIFILLFNLHVIYIEKKMHLIKKLPFLFYTLKIIRQKNWSSHLRLKKVFLEISQNPPENTYARVSSAGGFPRILWNF